MILSYVVIGRSAFDFADSALHAQRFHWHFDRSAFHPCHQLAIKDSAALLD